MKKQCLFLNPWFKDIIDTPEFDSVEQSFAHANIISQLGGVIRRGSNYKRIIFYRNHRLLIAYWLIACLRGQRMFLHEFYLPPLETISRKRWYYKALFKCTDGIIVHSNYEKQFLSNEFHVAPSKFHFVPYFYYGKLWSGENSRWNDGAQGQPIKFIIPGRHRDLQLINSMPSMPDCSFVVVGGRTDAIQFGNEAISSEWEVSKQRYEQLFDEADAVIIPLAEEYSVRSLGQIAILTAFVKRKPLIIADLPMIRDYIADDVCITYTAGNLESLTAAIKRLRTMYAEAVTSMLDKAQAFVSAFSREKYAQSLRDIFTR